MHNVQGELTSDFLAATHSMRRRSLRLLIIVTQLGKAHEAQVVLWLSC
jgi:hypothetical protein